MNPNYSERLALAMKQGVCSTSALASALGVSYQAIKKVLDGKSNALTAENNAKAALFLKVSSHWLATGQGGVDVVPATTGHTSVLNSKHDFESAISLIAAALSQADNTDRQAAKSYLLALCDDPGNADAIAAKLQVTLVPAPIKANKKLG